MDASRGAQARAVVIYTGLRIVLLALVWLIVELLTPIHGLWAVVVALLISGAISVVLLDRQRNAVGHAAAGLFGRINERIEASARAEDDDDPEIEAQVEQAPSAEGAEGEGRPENQPVDQQ